MTTYRQWLELDRKFIELHEAIRDNNGVECETIPDFFFPSEPDPESNKMMTEIAKGICQQCPLKQQCLDYAIGAGMHGIWGGTTYQERLLLSPRQEHS